MAKDASSVYERVKDRLKMRLLEVLDRLPDDRRRAMPREELTATLRQLLTTSSEELRQLNGASAENAERLVHDVIEEMLGFGPLDRFLNDPSITEIMINGPREMFVERDGCLERVESIFRDTTDLMAVIERLLGSVGLAVNESEPLCDASLPNGSRINVIIPPLVLNGPVVTIRTKSRTWTMDEYVKAEALSPEAAAFLRACVRAKVNLVVSGGTSTGKTTLVSILSNDIPAAERIITIENVAELELPARDHWIRLVAKSPNLEGRGEIPLRTLVKNALRMRPDRLILGEARGGEALDVVQAMHSGHDGVMTVLHANTPHAALERLETLMLMSGLDLPPQACRVQIASAVDLVVHLGRYADGSRRIAAIAQVLGTSQEGFALEELFLFDAQGFTPEGRLRGSCRYTGAAPKFLSKFRLANVEIPSWVTT